ncbi:hypothetical protein SpCBS45565_g01799 [Spizellomyces sp. 'palustris']|nr:hypothetical protein SpCBS45565_g01799 [Spizellomyces sp. 'palustris']
MLSRTGRGRAPGTSYGVQERFAFKYLRFRCKDVQKTIDYYQNLGMSVDWQTDQISYPAAADKDRPTRDKDRRKEEVPTEVKITEKATVVALSYRPTGKTTNAHNVQLIFEKVVSGDGVEEQSPHESQQSSMDHLASNNGKPGRVPHNYEYLVIYVHFVHRLAKRLSIKGFEIVLAPLDIAEVKMCITRDPNGLEVRLMELTDSQLNVPSTKKQWYARLGYYAIPTLQADASVRWYETILASHRTRTAQGQRITTLDLAVQRTPRSGGGGGGDIGTLLGIPGTPDRPISRKKPGAAATVRQAINQGQGFRLVDTEDFIVGLSRSVYYWLGNDLRSATCTVCFTEHADFGSGTTQGGFYDRKGSKLLGLGFEVPNLDAAINQLRYEFKEDLEWGHCRSRIQGIGTVSKLYDKLNKVWIELQALKGSERETPVKSADAPSAETAEDETTKRGRDQFAIDFSHLSGQARTLSEGAVYRLRKPEDADINLGAPAPRQPTTGLPVRAQSISLSPSTSEESISSSLSSLHIIDGDVGSQDLLKPKPPSTKVPAKGVAGNLRKKPSKADRERWMFLSRARSTSASW